MSTLRPLPSTIPRDWCDYNEYIMAPLHAILAISLILLMVSFIKARCTKQLKIHRLLYWFQIIHFASIVVWFALRAVSHLVRCDESDDEIFNLVHVIFYLIYSFQCGWLIVLLFTRLVLIFQGTIFRLSPFTISAFVFCYVLYVVLVLTVLYLLQFSSDYDDSDKTLRFLLWLCVFCFLLVVVLLDSFLMYRIMTVHRANRDNVSNPEILMRIITKTSLLSIISTSQTFLILIIAVAALFGLRSQLTSAIGGWLVMLDVYTNFVCILLSNKYYDPWYTKVCGRCHNKFHQCLTNCFADKENTDNSDANNDNASGTAEI
eukprot:176737_1